MKNNHKNFTLLEVLGRLSGVCGSCYGINEGEWISIKIKPTLEEKPLPIGLP